MTDGFRWSDEKNLQLYRQRGMTFEDVVAAIEQGKLIDDIPHPDTARFGHQRMLVVEIKEYACLVPYVLEDDAKFLKTIYRSRKADRLYAKREEDEEQA
jgi:hypothetical protein